MKIILLRNNISDQATLDKGITSVKNFALTIGLTLDFTQVTTTKQFTSVPFTNGMDVNSGFQITPQEVFDEAKRLGYIFNPDNIACLVFDSSKIIPSPTNPIDNGVIIQLPMNWYASYPDVFAEFLLHEICHYSATLNSIPDLTHKKYDPMWNSQWGQKSNIDYYLFLLKPFVKPTSPVAPFKPDVTITRQSDNGIETLGILRTTDGKFGCDTIERSWKNNQINISAIPKGNYTCQWKFMLRQLRYRYQVMNVPNRSGIFLHQMNYWWNSAGCIGLGSLPKDINSDGQIDIQNTVLITTAFENYMQKKDFQLTVC
jgi:hypothetical protein